MNVKRVGLLARVSTAEQTKGTSVDEQLGRCRDYSLNNEYKIVGEETDVISGTFILARSAFNKYLTMMSEGQLDVIVVDIPDRLGRGDAIAKCELLAQLNGGSIEYAAPGRDDTTVEGMALKATDMLVSGIERINIRRRTMGGRNAWARKGRVIATPYRPYGYKFHKEYNPGTGQKLDCQLVPVESEAEIVRKIYEWCAYEGLTTYRIAQRLSKMAIPTLSDVDPNRPKKRSPRGWWHKDTVHGILSNATYKGEWRYRKNDTVRVDTSKGVRTKVKSRKPEDVIPVAVPPIVSVELWQEVQERLAISSKRNFKTTRWNYLLRGRMRCNKCNRMLLGYTMPIRNPKWNDKSFYRCSHKYPLNAPNSCHSRNVPALPLEEKIWEDVGELLTDNDKLNQRVTFQQEETGKAHIIMAENITSLKTQNGDDNTQLDRLLILYKRGGLTVEKYLEEKSELDKKIQERLAQIQTIHGRMSQASPMASDEIENLDRLRIAVLRRMEEATFEQKVEILDMLKIECVFDDDKGVIAYSGVLGGRNVELDDKGVVMPSEASAYCQELHKGA